MELPRPGKFGRDRGHRRLSFFPSARMPCHAATLASLGPARLAVPYRVPYGDCNNSIVSRSRNRASIRCNVAFRLTLCGRETKIRVNQVCTVFRRNLYFCTMFRPNPYLCTVSPESLFLYYVSSEPLFVYCFTLIKILMMSASFYKRKLIPLGLYESPMSPLGPMPYAYFSTPC